MFDSSACRSKSKLCLMIGNCGQTKTVRFFLAVTIMRSQPSGSRDEGRCSGLKRDVNGPAFKQDWSHNLRIVYGTAIRSISRSCRAARLLQLVYA